MVPAEGSPKVLKLKSSGHQRRQNFGRQPQTLEGEEEGEGGPGGGQPPPSPAVYGRSNTSLGMGCSTVNCPGVRAKTGPTRGGTRGLQRSSDTGAAASQCVTPRGVRQFGGLWGRDPPPRGGEGTLAPPPPPPAG